jgi:lipoprotein signal peptidase
VKVGRSVSNAFKRTIPAVDPAPGQVKNPDSPAIVRNKTLMPLIVIFLLVSADRVSSGFAMISGVGSCNTGVSFGLFPGVPVWVWVGIALPVIVYFFTHALKELRMDRMRWGVYIFLSGAVSNLVARMLYGCVWDWMEVGFLDISFTLGDIYIDIGLAWMLLGVILSLRDNGTS